MIKQYGKSNRPFHSKKPITLVVVVVVVWSLRSTQSSTAVRPSLATFQSPGCCLGHTTTTGQGLHLTTPDPQGAGQKNSVPCSEREGVGAPWYHHQVIQQTQGPDFQPTVAPYLPHSGPGYAFEIADESAPRIRGITPYTGWSQKMYPYYIWHQIFILKDISNFLLQIVCFIGVKFIPPNFFEIDQVLLCQILIIYDVFNPGPSLLNHICDTDIEIGNDSCYHISWNIPGFPFECSLSTLLESEDCWHRRFLSDLPTGSIPGVQIRRVRWLWKICTSRDESVPGKYWRRYFQSSVWAISKKFWGIHFPPITNNLMKKNWKYLLE
jgi:hypothetical protein